MVALIITLTIFLLSAVSLTVFVLQKRKIIAHRAAPLQALPGDEGLFIILGEGWLRFVHSQFWLAVVGGMEKLLRRVRLVFMRLDNIFLAMIDRLRGHSSRIMQKNMESRDAQEKSEVVALHDQVGEAGKEKESALL